MKTEQLIWFIDSRFFYQNVSLDKMLHLANIHQKKLTIIIDAKIKSSKPWYRNVLKEHSSLLINDDDMLLVEKQAKLVNFFKMNAIKVEIIICESLNYSSMLNTEIAKNANSLVVIEDSPLSRRHPIFQMLTQINSSILLLSNKLWKHPINILGAIDPLHENARPEALDKNIVGLMKHWEEMLQVRRTIAHCYYIAPVLSKYKKKIVLEHEDGLRDFSKKSNLTKDQCVLLEGQPEEALASFIKNKKIDVLFIGLVARNKLEQFWVGSTTAALLTSLPCDMLLIKH